MDIQNLREKISQAVSNVENQGFRVACRVPGVRSGSNGIIEADPTRPSVCLMGACAIGQSGDLTYDRAACVALDITLEQEDLIEAGFEGWNDGCYFHHDNIRSNPLYQLGEEFRMAILAAK